MINTLHDKEKLLNILNISCKFSDFTDNFPTFYSTIELSFMCTYI